MFGFVSFSRLLYVVAAVCLLGGASAFAQHRVSVDVQEWPVADVVLFSGETLRGALTFHRQEEIINVQQEDGTFRSFSPVNVDHFIVRSASDKNENEVYVTYNWDLDKPYTDFKKPTFFQQLNHNGPLTLIMRESYIRRDVNNYSPATIRHYGNYDPYYNSMGSRYVEQIVPLFYLLMPDGEIKKLRNIHKDLSRIFGKKEKSVKEFMKQNKYSYDNPEQLAAIINYYNSIYN